MLKLSSQKVLIQVHRQIVLQNQKWPSAKLCPKCDLQHAHRQVSPASGSESEFMTSFSHEDELCWRSPAGWS